MSDSEHIDAPICWPPLGPGDDDPAAPSRGEPAALAPPPGPGDGGDDSFILLTVPPAGPGEAAQPPRRLTRVPVRPQAEE